MKTPPGWEANSLTDFLDSAHHNTFGTFQQHKYIWGHLSRIYDGFDRLTNNLYNSLPILPVLLYTRSHSAFMAATRLAVATQTVDVNPVLRSAVEYSVIAMYFKHHPKVASLWLKRHESEKTRAKVRNELRTGQVFRFVKEQHPRLGGELKRLYEASIDDGAHPNVAGVVKGLNVIEDLKDVTINTNFLTDEEPLIEFCLYMTSSVGVTVLEMGSVIFKERAKVLSLDTTVLKLRNENANIWRSLVKKHNPQWKPFL
jgi:hypothetical protein